MTPDDIKKRLATEFERMGMVDALRKVGAWNISLESLAGAIAPIVEKLMIEEHKEAWKIIGDCNRQIVSLVETVGRLNEEKGGRFRTALRKAVLEVKEHNAEYQHVTKKETIEEWEKLLEGHTDDT